MPALTPAQFAKKYGKGTEVQTKKPNYTWSWHTQGDGYRATVLKRNSPYVITKFPVGTEPSEMAAWAKKEIQILKLKDLLYANAN